MREPLSPAVERIVNGLARDSAGRVSIAELLTALTDDQEGRIAAQLGPQSEAWLTLRGAAGAAIASPFTRLDGLLHHARSLSRSRDSEGAVTSEFLLAAIESIDAACAAYLRQLGLAPGALTAGLGDEAPALPACELAVDDDPFDRLAAARVIDVNLNRAREALRVIDDYCRFVRDDAAATELAKRARHDLAQAGERLPAGLLLRARDTNADVGAGIATDREGQRADSRAVATAAVKRLQEALRSLEEFGKTIDAAFAAEIEQIRYRSYTLEKAIFQRPDRDALFNCRVCALLSGSECLASLEWTIAEAVAGGATMIQLREKALDDRALLKRAREVRRWTRAAGALLIINDRPEIARLCEADGVHLGQDDLAVADARRIAGPDAIIGVSAHDLTQLRRASDDGADYVGIGPTFPSKTKSFERFAGLELIRAASTAAALPAFAIGGIHAGNVEQVIEAGAQRVAVGAAIAQADDPRQAARALAFALTRANRGRQA
jgi:thiamine-phosphate pyrophosphorylase